jgi:hypothetical protein
VFANSRAQGGPPVGATPPCWNFLNCLVVASLSYIDKDIAITTPAMIFRGG